MNLDDPVATVLRVTSLLDRAEIPYALYGGLAVAAYGVARETKDADLAVASADTRKVADLLQQDGLRAETAFEGVRFGGLTVSRITLLGGEDDVGLNTVDLVQPRSVELAAAVIERAVRAPLRSQDITLLTPEDVVLFKILSTRDKDLEDAAAILQELTGRLDLDAIAAQVDRLARELEDHDVQERWQRCQRA